MTSTDFYFNQLNIEITPIKATIDTGNLNNISILNNKYDGIAVYYIPLSKVLDPEVFNITLPCTINSTYNFSNNDSNVILYQNWPTEKVIVNIR